MTGRHNQAIVDAAQGGHLDVVKFLVEHGADVTAQRSRAVVGTAGSQQLEVVKYLVEHGAAVSANVLASISELGMLLSCKIIRRMLTITRDSEYEFRLDIKDFQEGTEITTRETETICKLLTYLRIKKYVLSLKFPTEVVERVADFLFDDFESSLLQLELT